MSTLKSTWLKIAALFLAVICIGITIIYWWGFYATATQRSGLYGSMYIYYHLTPIQYVLYNLLVVTCALVLAVLQIIDVIGNSSRMLKASTKACLVFIAILVLCEVMLQNRFTGKA